MSTPGFSSPLWVERFLGGAQRVGEQWRPLAIVPRPVLTTDRVVVRDRAAVGDHRVECGGLDGGPLRTEPARISQRMEREVGRGAVRIGVCEAARDLSLAAGRLPDGVRGRRLDGVMERFEAIPRDRGLERVVDHAVQDQPLHRVGHADEGVAPHAGRALAMRVRARGLWRTAVVGAAFERARHPWRDIMIGGLEGQHHDGGRAVSPRRC